MRHPLWTSDSALVALYLDWWGAIIEDESRRIIQRTKLRNWLFRPGEPLVADARTIMICNVVGG